MKWCIVILLGVYETKDKQQYIHIKAKRYSIVRNILNNSKQIVASSHIIQPIIVGDTYLTYTVTKRKDIIPSVNPNKDIKKLYLTGEPDEDTLFNMHNKECFRDDETLEFPEYKYKNGYRYTFSSEDKFNPNTPISKLNSEFLEDLKSKTEPKDIVSKIDSIYTLKSYTIILLTIYAAVKRSSDCSFVLKEETLRERSETILETAIELYRTLM